jgi:hypothetical protein
MRHIETKRRDNEARKGDDLAFYREPERTGWVSLKGKQHSPENRIRQEYIAVENIDPETQRELVRAVSGGSHKLDRYHAARIIVAQAIERGLIRESDA